MNRTTLRMTMSERINHWFSVRSIVSKILFYHLVLLTTVSVYGQSTNCYCPDNLLSNGTFESSDLAGWNLKYWEVYSSFTTAYDDCGSTSIRLNKWVSFGTSDEALWQQENNVQPGITYNLAFDAATENPSVEQRVYLRFYKFIRQFID